MAGEIQIGGTTFATESGGTVTIANVDSATNRTNLGLGSMSTQNAHAVALTGGSLVGTEIDLKSSGTSVYKSNGSTAVISESSGTVTVDNATLGSAVVFPAGHILQSKATTTRNFANFSTNTPAIVSGFNQQITVTSSNSKMLVFIFLSGAGKSGSSTTLNVDITESTTSLNETLSTSTGYSNNTSYMTVDTTLFYEHTHNQTAGTSLTYTPKFSSYNNVSQSFINNYLSSNGDSYSYILVQELMV